MPLPLMLPQYCIVGAEVTYWPIRHQDGTFDGEPFHSVISAESYLASTGDWVCHLKGKAGYVLCKHLTRFCPETKERTFSAYERKGELPYIVSWIGSHHMPSTELLPTLEKALERYGYLNSIGCRPTLMLNLIVADKLPIP